MTAQRIPTDDAHVVMNAELGAGQSFQNYAESSGCDVEAARLDPNPLCIRDPRPAIIQLGVDDKVTAVPCTRVQPVCHVVESSDRHLCPLLYARKGLDRT